MFSSALSKTLPNILRCHSVNSILNRHSKLGFHVSSRKYEKIKINGMLLNYETAGKGDNVALCLPGALGSSKTDFQPQLENLASDNLKLIAWDPPGYGSSIPPHRDFHIDFLHEDASLAAQMMKDLGYDKYHLLGWSDGGITAMIMAALYPENTNKMVIWGANAYVTQEDINAYLSIREVDKWSERMRAPLEEIYGKQNLAYTWEGWVDILLRIFEDEEGDICTTLLPKINCPTLIIHGSKDAMVPAEHPHYINEHIEDCRLIVWKDGKHNLHLRFADRFNKVVEDFIMK